MLSNVIVDQLDSQVATLTKTSNLFAEFGEGNQYVVVKTTNDVSPFPTVDVIQEAVIQILVVGFPVSEGITLAKQVTTVVKSLIGNYVYGTDNYRIKSNRVRNNPVPINWGDRRGFSMNFVFYYEEY